MLFLSDAAAIHGTIAKDVYGGSTGYGNVWDLVEYEDVPCMHENRISHPPCFLAADWTMSFTEVPAIKKRGRPKKELSIAAPVSVTGY
jgi:hypothetical protein